MIPSIKLRTPPKRNGECAIYLHIHIRGKLVRIPLSIHTHPYKWDKVKQRIIAKTKQDKDKNLIIGKAIGRTYSILADYRLQNLEVTAAQFQNEYKNPLSKDSFLDFYEVQMKSNYNRDKIGESCYKGESLTLKKLKVFREQILFADICQKMIIEFDEYHTKYLQSKGAKTSCQRIRSIKHIKKYLNVASNQGKKYIWPFRGFSVPKYATNKVILEAEEIKRIEMLYDDKELLYDRLRQLGEENGLRGYKLDKYASESGVQRIQRVMQCFLFRCVTGIRHIDILTLSKKNIIDGILSFQPTKTSSSSLQRVNMPITQAMNKYMLKGNEKLVPSISNQKQNAYLKEVAQMGDIDKAITTTVARRSFATNSLTNGMPVEVLQLLLGHRCITTTMQYVRVGMNRIKSNMYSIYGKP